MRSREIVEAFPAGELLLEIDIIHVGEELVELLFVCAMRTLDLGTLRAGITGANK